MTTLLTLQNLSLSYPLKTIFKDVTFTLNEGDRVGVLGLNGHGKSSLFKVLAEIQTPDTTVPAFIYDKNVNFSLFLVPQELPIFKDVSINDYYLEFYPEFKKIKKELDVIEQKLADPDADFDKLIEIQGKHFDQLEKLGEGRIVTSYHSYLKLFKLENTDRTIMDLSGGEQRKLALSLGLSAPHQIILWDEPTNHLDLETIELFEEELQNARNSYMIISHDRALLNNVVERIVHIQHGKIRSFEGTYAQYLTFLQEEDKSRAKELDKLSNYQRREKTWISRGAKARRTKSKKRIEDYSTLNKSIEDLKARAHKKVSLNVQSSGRKTKVLFRAENLTLGFGKRTLFNDLNFEIKKGDKIAILGNNGVGKSSLLKLFCNDLQPTSGNVYRAESLNVGLFSQKRETLNPEMTPWELIGEGIDYVFSNTGDKRHVASYLEGFLFRTEELRRPIKTFSGGEKNRLQLAQFMKHAQDIWIFDEPTNDLDLETIGVLEEELKSYEGALIVVGHDRTFIENVTDRCWLLHNKKMEMFDGGMEQAEAFFEAIALEEKLNDLKAKSGIKTGDAAGPVKTKPSLKDKERFEKVEVEISGLEAVIAGLKEKLAGFDYSNSSATKKTELTKLEKTLDDGEEKLEKLFVEWSMLQEKLG